VRLRLTLSIANTYRPGEPLFHLAGRDHLLDLVRPCCTSPVTTTNQTGVPALHLAGRDQQRSSATGLTGMTYNSFPLMHYFLPGLFDPYRVRDDHKICALSFDLFYFMNTRYMFLTTNLSRVLIQSDLFYNLLCLTL
jgi:hypothetical protein